MPMSQDAECPDCGAAFEVEDSLEEGDRLPCPECGTALEVVEVEPVVLAAAGEAEPEEVTWKEAEFDS